MYFFFFTYIILFMNNDNNDEIKVDLDEESDTNDIVDSDIEYTNDDDDIVSEEEEQNPKSYIKKLKDEIKQLKKDKTDLLTNWQKDKAEFINARKRDEESKADVVRFANQILINDLLPIIDGYEQAKVQSTWNSVDEAWRKGIEAIIDKIYNALKRAGVEAYGAQGDDFDPNIYEAIGQEQTDDKVKDHKIAEILQKGYKMHDKVIRVSLVKVYHFE